MTTRRPIGAALLLTMVCLNGCYNFAAPIDPTPTIALDPKLLGSWRCLNGDTKQDEPPATLMFTRARDNVYAARLDVPKEKPGLYEAFASRVKDEEFLSVRDLGDQAKFPWYVVHYAFLKPNVLDLQLLDEDKVTEAERSAASLRPVLECHMGEPALFSDFVTCVRLSDEASTTTVLDIGDLAPPLDVESWLQGTPIAAFETGKWDGHRPSGKRRDRRGRPSGVAGLAVGHIAGTGIDSGRHLGSACLSGTLAHRRRRGAQDR